MRLILLTFLVMVAFATNSILNRMALVNEGTGPAAFAMIRLASGAVTLATLVFLRSGKVSWPKENRFWGPVSLAVYMLGFSFAYVTLDAGVGALVLFGGVQVTMFAGSLLHHEKVPLFRVLGAMIAFAGLLVLLWPTDSVTQNALGVVVMILAAIGWGVYSLLGRGSSDALGATAANFALAMPLGVLSFVIFQDGISSRGMLLAIVSGGLTSGAGYAVWYRVLPNLASTVAAVAQLTVPVIAVAGGVVFLGEDISPRFVMAACLVLGGVVVSLKR